MSVLLALTLILGVPDRPGPYSWVCGYLDNAPTLFGVMGLPGEAQDRGLVLDRDAVVATVAAECPQHNELLDSSIGLVVGG